MTNTNELKSTTKIGSNIANYFFILIQLTLLFFAFHQFNIEQETKLPKILPLVLVGFSIHYWLQQKFKLPFFVLLSFAAILMVVGWLNGFILIGIGLLILGICHLPINYNLRLFILGLTTISLVLFRANIFKSTSISYLIPFIGTMFMLRLIIYVYDLKHEKEKVSFWKRIAYFFLLPNVCFPLFPLIDFKVFKATYYNENNNEIYAIGLRRIFRGLIHIITYRFLYYLVVPDPTEIEGVYSILQFMIFSYTLILRLSGMYHISLGILSLFGFNLPEIFNNYFFASSFNNIWKRINIYWREALMKVFYYPIYFKVRKLNKAYAIAITILIVFVINWAMHGYQWFWVRGTFPLEPNDFLFWMVFGTAVMLNSIYLQKIRAPKKLKPTKSSNLKTSFVAVIKPIGMFAFMCSIWMMWSSSSLTEWIYLLSFFGKGTFIEWSYIIGCFISLIVLLMILNHSYKIGWLRVFLNFYNKKIAFFTLACILLTFILSFPKLSSSIKINGQPFISFLQETKLSAQDKRTMERGYYQKLLSVDNNSLQLSKTQFKKPKNWYHNNAYEKTKSILRKQFKPNFKTTFKNATLTTNSWGMRDQEYKLKKDTNTFRFALLGGSYEMGAGVNNNETFESITESLLNKHFTQNVEILNFAVGGYHLVENVFNIDKAISFNPDAIIYTAHSNEFSRMNSRLIELLSKNIDINDPFILSIKKKSGIKGNMCMLEKQNRLKPFTNEIMNWGYKSISNKCKLNNIVPIWVYIPALGDAIDKEYKKTLDLAKKHNFITIEIKDPYKNQDINDLKVAPWDFHLNKKGHKIIANNLYKKLTSHQELKLK